MTPVRFAHVAAEVVESESVVAVVSVVAAAAVVEFAAVAAVLVVKFGDEFFVGSWMKAAELAVVVSVFGDVAGCPAGRKSGCAYQMKTDCRQCTLVELSTFWRGREMLQKNNSTGTLLLVFSPYQSVLLIYIYI